MFLEDATGGIFINTDRPFPVHAGDLVEADGHAEGSYRSELAPDPGIKVLGRGKNPRARRSSYQDLVAGKEDCRLVTIRGRVRAADVGYHSSAPAGHLDLLVPGGEVEIYVNEVRGLHPDKILDSLVEVTGVAGGSFDAKWQLIGVIVYVQNASAIRILKSPTTSAEQLPLTDIDDVLPSRSVQDFSHRVRVQGTVTYYRKGSAAVLERKGKSIYVQTRQTNDLAVGDVADAYGFASDNGYAPGLREAAIVPTGKHAPVAPRVVSYAQALSGAYSDNLVSLSGRLVSQLHDVGADTLVLDVDGHLVNSYLEGSSPLQNFAVGSRLRITGICRVLPGNPWQAPYVFHLELRDAADAKQIADPPWGTIRHLFELLSALAFFASAIAIWAMILRRQVLNQSRRIQRSMKVADERSRILEKISSSQTPEVVLGEICKSVMVLLPGSHCTYSLDTQKLSIAGECGKLHSPRRKQLFRLALKGPDEQTLGYMMVTGPCDANFSEAQQQEVYAILTELATLSMRQSLLYKGLLHRSTHDPLTELPNRRLCDSRFAKALEEAQQRNGRLAVIYIDVNRFKEVNDRFGHKVGDNYLKEISARLLRQIRPTDTLARVGGDEFLLISPFATTFDQTDAIAARLKSTFDEPFVIDGHCIQGSASFGVATYPENGTSAEALKRNADHAMYLAKRHAACASDALIDIAIVTPDELAVAIQKDQLRLAYQPQFSSSGRLTGIEALLRLQDPILGLLAPDAFIAVAERSDVIVELGSWVLRQALRDALGWQLDTGEQVVIAVNVSIRQITFPGFAAFVLTCLEECGYPAERLELELVERSLAAGGEEVTRQLDLLHRAGVRISIDDFGTGHSCLSMLHRLPIDTIKLDRSFIRAMQSEPKVLPVIRAVSEMARSLGKRVLAEGVEHEQEVSTLLKVGEMEFQGYLLGRPEPAQKVDRLIEGWRAGIAMPHQV